MFKYHFFPELLKKVHGSLWRYARFFLGGGGGGGGVYAMVIDFHWFVNNGIDKFTFQQGVVASVAMVIFSSLPQSYLALPKGGLVAEHVLILPIGHYGASTDAPVVRW